MDILSAKDKKNALRFAVGLAQSVGDRIAKASGQHIRVSFKGEVDLVTQFDRQAQNLIIDAMLRQYPGYGVLSEEDVSTGAGYSVRWIVDPLDGTTNFAHGLPIWAISIALEVEKEIVLGVVYDPTRREMFTAMKDSGARLNGRKIRVSNTSKLGHSLLVTGFPYDIRRTKKNNLRQFSEFAVRARAVRRLGSAALDLCYTACGRFDGYWELKLSSWDQAAGSVILHEAGGKVTDFAGRKFSIYGDEVLGTNGLIHRPMIRILKRLRD